MQVAFFVAFKRSSAVQQAQCDRSRLDIGGADVGSEGMSISSGSLASACGGGPSSPPSGPFRRTPIRRLRLDVLGDEFIAGMEYRGLCDSLVEIVVAVGTHAATASAPDLVLVAEVCDCARRPFTR